MDELELLAQLGLLSPEQRQQTEQQARTQGLLSLGNALMQAGRGGGQRVSTLQGLGMAAPAYMQGQQQVFDQTLQSILRRTQVQDLLAKRREEEQRKARMQQIQSLTPALYRERMGQVPTTIPTETYEDVQTTTEGVVGLQLDPERLRQLAMLGPEGRAAALDALKFEQAMTPPEVKPLVVKPNEILLDPVTRKPIYQAPGVEELPNKIREFQIAKREGLVGPEVSFTDYLKAGGTNIVLPSEGERKAGALTSRLQFNINKLNEILGKKPEVATPGLMSSVIEGVTGSEYLSSLTKDADRQRIEAAQLDILDAALTLGTGAAYTREQLEGYRKAYFPQLEDKGKPGVIKDKQDRLQNVLEAAFMASGRAAPPRMPTAPTPAAPRQDGIVVRRIN